MRERVATIREQRFEEQAGLCYYCKSLMSRHIPEHKKPLPSTACTLEHLIDRLSPHRWDENFDDSPKRYVAACVRCNHARSNWNQRHAPKELITRLANNHGRKVSAPQIILEYYRTHEYVPPPVFEPEAV